MNVVQHLVHEGAKLNVVDHEQRTPLLKGVLSGNQHPQLYNHICHFLLSEGAHKCKIFNIQIATKKKIFLFRFSISYQCC